MTNTLTAQLPIIEKIRKLLAMAKSGTEHEAALAAARAADLMAKHQLDEATVRLDTGRAAEPIVDDTIEKAKRRIAWKGTIASGLCYAFGTKMYWSAGDICMFGRQSALQTVSYMFNYLCNEVERLVDEAWEDYKDLAPSLREDGRSWKNGFRLGAASAISLRLRAQRQDEVARRNESKHQASREILGQHLEIPSFTNESTPECRALAVIDLVESEEKEVEAAYAEKSRGWGTVRGGRGTRSHGGWNAGQSAGSGVSINTGSARGLRSAVPQVGSRK